MTFPQRSTLMLACCWFAVAGRATAQPATCAQNAVTFLSTGAAQSFVVPAGVTTISAIVTGAGGGGDGFTFAGGPGAFIAADIPVAPGQALTLIVGGKGADGNQSAAGGGGASVVAATAGFVPYVIAAGGGGTGIFAQDNGTTIDASATTTAKNGNGTGAGAGGVGTLGGGAGPTAAANGSGGGGGAGVTGDGDDSIAGAVEGGTSLNGSAAGGISAAGTGGFGGGGGGGSVGGGGGGGYAGGGGGGATSNGAGGGGASYLAPGATLLTPISLQGTPEDGAVTLCYALAPVTAVPTLDPAAMAVLAAGLGFAGVLWLRRRQRI